MLNRGGTVPAEVPLAPHAEVLHAPHALHLAVVARGRQEGSALSEQWQLHHMQSLIFAVAAPVPERNIHTGVPFRLLPHTGLKKAPSKYSLGVFTR